MPEKKSIMLVILAATIVGTAVFSIQRGETISSHSNRSGKVAPSPPSSDDIKLNFPSVEYNNERTSTEARRQKSQKYDRHKILNSEIYQDEQEVSFADWITTDAALPVAQSDMILIGKLVSSDAYLSEKKMSVYSEFRIEIEKIIKNKSKASLEDQKFVKAERDGGIVIFPNGFKTWYFVSGQRMPQVGSRYLFFLTHNFPVYGSQKEDLFLLTGYELRDGLVSPLDMANGGDHPSAILYRGKKESQLLSDLADVLGTSKKGTN